MSTNYTIIEVTDSKTQQEFILFPTILYKNEKMWIRPLDKDIKAVFDPKKNKSFQKGECIRWILRDKKNKTVGRVAAFVDYKTSGNNDQPTGGLGFFECIDNKEAAFILFDNCRNWLQQRGMEAMDGPVNFGDRDRWWGLLVDGFSEPNYCMPYNFSYYQRFFEDYGFKNYFNQFTYYSKVTAEGLSPEIFGKAERISQNPDYFFRRIELNNVKKYAEDFRIIYNKAWARFPGVKEISPIHAMALLKSMKPIIDEDIMWFAYYRDEPAAFYLMVPEINQILKHVNGKLNMIGKLKFLYHKWRGTCTKALGLIFGVVPEHQGKGLEAALIIAFSKVALAPNFPYKEIEFNWIGDFNPVMIRLVEQIGAKIVKTHVTYRYLFDRAKEFKRAKRVN